MRTPPLYYPTGAVPNTPPLYYPTGHTAYHHVGEDSSGMSKVSQAISVAATGAAAYHGYKRTGSVGWTVVWALLGGLVPVIVLPVALAQGYAKKKGG